jgi:hypothetical protein
MLLPVDEVCRSRSSHNGLLVLTGGEFDRTRVYCDMKHLPAWVCEGRKLIFRFNATGDITEIQTFNGMLSTTEN